MECSCFWPMTILSHSVPKNVTSWFNVRWMHQKDPRIVVFTFMPQKWHECPPHRNYLSSLSALTSGSQIMCIWAFFQRDAPLACKNCLRHLQLSSQPRWVNDGTIRETGQPVALQLVSVPVGKPGRTRHAGQCTRWEVEIICSLSLEGTVGQRICSTLIRLHVTVVSV